MTLTTCNICGRKFTGYGNNPEPILPVNFTCCDECNLSKVIPARMAAIMSKNDTAPNDAKPAV